MLEEYERGNPSTREVLQAELSLRTCDALLQLGERLRCLESETARSGRRLLFATWALVLATAGVVWFAAQQYFR
jgi:hypothetical protein